MEKNFEGRYTVKVGDVCYALIGQIVNRRLLAVRYQTSGGLIVNSPIEAPVLIERVQEDWGAGSADILKASLQDDIHATSPSKEISQELVTERFINPALARLRLYFPDVYDSLTGSDLEKRKKFERQQNQRRSATP